jgi:hypothetical protein
MLSLFRAPTGVTAMSKAGKGAACPSCNKQTFHDRGSYRECSQCGTVGWGWHHQVKNVGKGRGYTCWNCGNLTLHDVLTKQGVTIYRCGVCDYSCVLFDREDAKD